jgi:uncharacterized protein YecT (DUF1311 family)
MSGHVDYDRELGKCAYDAYREASEDLDGERLPTWDDLLPKVQKAWIAAADAARKHEADRTTQF